MVTSRAKFAEDTMVTEDNLEVSQEILLKRLRRIEGQIRGIQKMIAEDRDCVSIVMQLAAVRSGIEGIGALVLNNCMKLCFYKGPDATTDIDSLARAVAIWGRVRGGDLVSELKRGAKSGNV
jgi:DNA-binding FrmR family transcriptional regulator